MATAAAVPRTWAAAAAARALTASGHNYTAWASTRKGSRYMAEAAVAGMAMAAAGGEAVGGDGRISNAALENAAATLRAASLALRRARAAFGEAAAQARSSAAEWDVAADACAMAGDEKGGREFRGLAGEARTMARDADKRASLAGRDARATRAASRGWKASAAWWAEGTAWPGDGAAWAGRQSRVHADAEQDWAVWSKVAKLASEAVRNAIKYVWECAASAEKAVVAAEEAGGLVGEEAGAEAAMTPDARDAAAAWRDAMAAVRNAPDACRPRA